MLFRSGALILIPALSYFLLRDPALERRVAAENSVAPAGTTDTSQRQGMPDALTTCEKANYV